MDGILSIDKRTRDGIINHGCTHMAECLELTTNELTRVTLKKIVDEEDDQLLDFYQVNYLVQIVLLTCVSRA